MDGGWQLWAKRGGETGPTNLAMRLTAGAETESVCVFEGGRTSLVE